MASSYSVTILGYPITASLTRLGADWLVTVTGGCAPHIGSISAARWDGSAPVLETVLLPTHRDDVVGSRFASALCHHLRTTVTVVCGIHYDGPSREDLKTIVTGTEDLLRQIQADLPTAE